MKHMYIVEIKTNTMKQICTVNQLTIIQSKGKANAERKRKQP